MSAGSRGQLVVLSGPSGVGKDSVAKALAAGNPDEFVISVSVTSRLPREGEREGLDYLFVAREQFEERVAGGEFLEYARYSGNYYGTPRESVDTQRDMGKNVILVIEGEGAKQVRAMGGDALLIFLMPPDWATLERRLLGRGTETQEQAERRLAIAKREIAAATEYDFVVVNADLEDCAGTLRDIIRACRYRARNQRDFIEEVLGDA